jgi:hypothetical protein
LTLGWSDAALNTTPVQLNTRPRKPLESQAALATTCVIRASTSYELL